jgi:hypothetical protein
MSARYATPGAALTPPRGIAGSRLASLAVLQANFDVNGRSYLDNFVPFVTQALVDLDRASTVAEVAAAVHRRFGLTIPQPATKSILERSKRAGVERRDHLYWLKDKTSTFDEAQGNDLLRCHNALKQGLRAHAEEHGVQMTDAEAELSLAVFIDDHVASLVLSTAGQQVDTTSEPSFENEFLVASYVERISESDPAAYGYLLTLLQGSMLASALYLPHQGETKRKFRNTTFYLDTPFLIRLLGFAGPELSLPAAEVVSLAKAYGAEIACFEHTVLELRGVLSRAGSSLRSRGRGQAYLNDVERFFASKGAGPADVERVANGLERSLRNAGVSVKPLPLARDASVDEGALRRAIDEEIRYKSDGTLQHDVSALAAVARLRGAHTASYLEDSRAIFVTTNDSLVRASRAAATVQDARYTWPLAILDHTIATLLWLKEPVRAPDLPKKQLAADCFAALRPDGALWARYVDELRKLADDDQITDDDVVTLRYSLDAQRALVDQTRGDPAAVNTDTILKVLERTRAQAQAPVRALLTTAEAEASRARREAAEAKEQATEMTRSREVERSERERVESAARAEAERFEATTARRAERLGQRRAQRVVRLARWFVAAATVALELALFLGWSPLGADAPTFVRVAVIAVGSFLLLGQVLSDRVGRWWSRLEQRLSRRIAQRELRLWADEPEPED